MRVSALVLGALATVGSGYLAAAAVESSGAPPKTTPNLAPAPAGQLIWYGGVLEPVVVAAYAADPEAITLRPSAPLCEHRSARAEAHPNAE